MLVYIYLEQYFRRKAGYIIQRPFLDIVISKDEVFQTTSLHSSLLRSFIKFLYIFRHFLIASKLVSPSNIPRGVFHLENSARSSTNLISYFGTRPPCIQKC